MMDKAHINRRDLLGALAGLSAVGLARADDYPSRPVRLLVGFPPGQGSDSTARAVAARMQTATGQPWFVENRVGASGTLAQQAGSSATPDGYTVLLTSLGPLVMLYASAANKPPQHPVHDYAPIGGISDFPMVLAANPDFPAKTVRELVELAKAKPGEINFASSGPGLTAHMSMEMLCLQAGIRMTHVPYKGTAPAFGDLVAGRVSLTFETPMAVLPMVRDGRLRAIAVVGKHRLASLPDVPTIAESGYPNFVSASWLALFAPRKTPQAIVDKLSTALREVVTTPEMRTYFASSESEPMPMNSRELSAFVQQELDKWGSTAQRAGVQGS